MGFEIERCERCGNTFVSDGTNYKCPYCGFDNSWDNPEYRRLVRKSLAVGCIKEAYKQLKDALTYYSEYFS